MSNKVRYKVTKEQVEKLVENFVSESAAPEAKKHVKGSVSTETVGHKPKTTDGRTGKPQAPEVKKHIKGSTTGKQVEKRSNTPKVGEEEWGVSDDIKQSSDAKKHVKGSVKTK